MSSIVLSISELYDDNDEDECKYYEPSPIKLSILKFLNIRYY